MADPFNDDFGDVIETNTRRRDRQAQGVFDQGDSKALSDANALLTKQVEEATGGPLMKIDPNEPLWKRAAKGVGNRLWDSSKQVQSGLKGLTTPPSAENAYGSMSAIPGPAQAKGVFDTLVGGLDFLGPFSIAAGRIAKETAMNVLPAAPATPEGGRPMMAPGGQGQQFTHAAPSREEVAEGVGTGVEVLSGVGGLSTLPSTLRAGKKAMSKFGGAATGERMEAAVGATFENIAPHLKPEQKAKVAAYLTSPGHNEDLFAEAKSAMEGALHKVNGKGDAKQASNVLGDVLRTAKSRIAAPMPGPGAIDNNDNIILHGAEARMEMGGTGPYPNVMPDPSHVSEVKVASLTQIAEGSEKGPLAYGSLHRALDTLHTYMQNNGIEVSPGSGPPRSSSNPMSVTGPSGVSYGDILEAARQHWGGKGDPDTGWYLLRQVFDQDDKDLMRVFDHEVLLGGEEAVAKTIAGPQVRESSYSIQTAKGPVDIGTMLAIDDAEKGRRASLAIERQPAGGFKVEQAFTAEEARGRGLQRKLYRTAFERYGEYQGPTTGLTDEGRGLQQRLMRTDPDIYGHQQGEILPHTLDELATHAQGGGGATVDPRTGQAVSRDTGYSVSVAPEREMSIPKDEFTYRDLQKFTRANQDALRIEGAQLGLWEDGGRVYMDISKTVDDLAFAREEALKFGQRAIWDWKNQTSIPMQGEARTHGFPNPQEPLTPRAIRAAQEYDKAVTNPESRGAWDALARETDRLYDELVQRGYGMSVEPGQPYASADEMTRDFKNTGVLRVSGDNMEHPFWTPEQNAKFRFVHDVLGHIETGHQFDLAGEERAFLRHAERLTPGENLSRGALQTEVYGQAAAAVAHNAFQEQKAFLSRNGIQLPPMAERFAKNAQKSIQRGLTDILGDGWREMIRRLNAPDLEGAEASTSLMMGVGKPPRLPGERAAKPTGQAIETALMFAKQGMEGAFWYKGAREELVEQFGDEWEKFADLLAMTSPGKSVEKNLKEAYAIWNEWKGGADWQTATRSLSGKAKTAQADQARRLLYDGEQLDTILKGREKVWSFAHNIKGDFSKFTVDRWMWRTFYPEQYEQSRKAFNMRHPDETWPGWSGGPGKYRVLERWAQETAPQIIGPHGKPLQPAELQAAIWVGARLAAGETAANEPLQQMLAAYKQTDVEKFFDDLALSAKGKKKAATALMLGLMVLPELMRGREE